MSGNRSRHLFHAIPDDEEEPMDKAALEAEAAKEQRNQKFLDRLRKQDQKRPIPLGRY
jgi:hypothetical protein